MYFYFNKYFDVWSIFFLKVTLEKVSEKLENGLQSFFLSYALSIVLTQGWVCCPSPQGTDQEAMSGTFGCQATRRHYWHLEAKDSATTSMFLISFSNIHSPKNAWIFQTFVLFCCSIYLFTTVLCLFYYCSFVVYFVSIVYIRGFVLLQDCFIWFTVFAIPY